MRVLGAALLLFMLTIGFARADQIDTYYFSSNTLFNCAGCGVLTQGPYINGWFEYDSNLASGDGCSGSSESWGGIVGLNLTVYYRQVFLAPLNNSDRGILNCDWVGSAGFLEYPFVWNITTSPNDIIAVSSTTSDGLTGNCGTDNQDNECTWIDFEVTQIGSFTTGVPTPATIFLLSSGLIFLFFLIFKNRAEPGRIL